MLDLSAVAVIFITCIHSAFGICLAYYELSTESKHGLPPEFETLWVFQPARIFTASTLDY
jgi:hypothetical protein